MTNSAVLEVNLRASAAFVMIGAVALPTLLGLGLAPAPTVLNQCLSLGLWGFVISLAFGTRGHSSSEFASIDLYTLAGALAALVAGLGWSALGGYLPAGIAAAALATLLAAGAVAATGRYAAVLDAPSSPLVPAFFWALIIAGGLNAGIACVQVLAPAWADGVFIANSSIPGRAVGNLRQPNHLSSLLLWSLIAVVALIESTRISRSLGSALAALMVFALVLSGSRTGVLGTCVLAAWGLFDRRLSGRTRLMLVGVPALYGLAWLAMSAWGHLGGHVFGAQDRLAPGSSGDYSSSRFAIWRNALALIAADPWTGIGFGEFNLAWTLSSLPDRPLAFFDHTHNLPLQLVAELGVPLGLLTTVMLLVAFVQAGQRAWIAPAGIGVIKRAAFMLVLMIGLHSLLEYPLWYSYFLSPAAFAWGIALSRPPADGRPIISSATAPRWQRAVAVGGIALTLGAIAATLDYHRIAAIYEPPIDAAPLEERIAHGQRSPLFGHHADYAAATAFGEPKAPLSPSQELAFRRAPHHLLDIRLMIAWSQALVAQGETDKGRWLAARIREFRNSSADEFFEPCSNPAEAGYAFQCQAPQRSYRWRDFVGR